MHPFKNNLSFFLSGCARSSLLCVGSSLLWLLPLLSTGSGHGGFSSFGTQAESLPNVWNLPASGIEPASPALAGSFLSTGPPRKSPKYFLLLSSAQFSSVAQSCPTLCDPMNHSTPGLPVHHQLLEFTQTCVHRVSDAIQPSHPLSSPSPPAPNPSQHQSLFQ